MNYKTERIWRKKSSPEKSKKTLGQAVPNHNSKHVPKHFSEEHSISFASNMLGLEREASKAVVRNHKTNTSEPCFNKGF
jgi:hypothetical protein